MTRDQYDNMTPAQRVMWAVEQGMNPDPPKQRTNKRAERMQEAIVDIQKTLNPDED